jgi:sensor domain CHASE-containing protein/nitrogen-specific signal transduction histidine kinase
MSLKSRVTLILLVVVSLYGTFDYAIHRWIIFPSFIALEEEEAKSDMERCVQALRRELHHLNNLTGDWAAWDDTYRFVQDQYSGYIKSNLLLESFTDNDLNIIYICDVKGEVVWGELRDLETGEKIHVQELAPQNLSESHFLLQHKSVESSLAGVFVTARGPMLVASRPIITSENEGPIRGTLVMGRFLSDELVETLVEQTRVKFQVWPITEGSIPAEDVGALKGLQDGEPFLISESGNDKLSVYTTFRDIRGFPALLLRADVPKDITARGLTVLRFAVVSIIAVGIILLMILVVFLQRGIVAPITKLTDHAITVGKTDDLSARLAMDRGDEIGTLSKEFDRMVEQLSEARKKLLEQSYRFGLAEMSSGILHNVRNALSPLAGAIQTLREELHKVPIQEMQSAQRELAEESPVGERREDLIRFVEITERSLAGLLSDMRSSLDDMAARVFQIEEILRAHEQFSRAERPVEKIRLDELVGDSMALLSASFPDAVAFQIDESVKELGPLKTHRVVLVQVFANILGNALKAIERASPPRGEVRIEAEVEHGEAKEMIHIRICDNGIGIEPSELDRIFQRGLLTRKHGSTGTGLHWCANSVTAMGGRLYAESEGIGCGTCFHVLLPRHK